MVKNNGNSGKMSLLERQIQALAKRIQNLPEAGEIDIHGNVRNIKALKKSQIWLEAAYADPERKMPTGYYAFLTMNGTSAKIFIPPSHMYSDRKIALSKLNYALVTLAKEYRNC